MNKKNLYLLVLLAGVALIVFSLFNKNKQEIADLEINEEDAGDVAGENVNPDYLEGVLYASDAPEKGNLKLSSEGRDVYIKTGRDFNGLFGLQVLVFIDGTLDNFELLDIQPKLEKDGYILQQ